MFDVFEKYATNEKLETEGFKLELAPLCGVLVARANNENYLRLMAEEYEKNREVLDREDAQAIALDKKITRQVQAETILVGFYGKIAYKGGVLKYSKVNAEKLLSVKDFQMKVMLAASDRANYALKVEANDAKK